MLRVGDWRQLQNEISGTALCRRSGEPTYSAYFWRVTSNLLSLERHLGSRIPSIAQVLDILLQVGHNNGSA